MEIWIWIHICIHLWGHTGPLGEKKLLSVFLNYEWIKTKLCSSGAVWKIWGWRCEKIKWERERAAFFGEEIAFKRLRVETGGKENNEGAKYNKSGKE